ncbi:MAG: hydroxyacylglutathione hydrolase [Halieaceae bacterium]|jgi:hydroxyacylglutathione hydrolase
MSIKCIIVPVTAYQQNCSILKCEETGRGAIVDPGGDIDKINQAIEQIGADIEKILITHGHMDHCAATLELSQSMGIPVEGPHKDDDFWISQLPEVCKMSGFPIAQPFVPDRWLEQGDTVTVGKQVLEVYHCPGHTPGHVIFFHRERQLAIVGDVIFQGSIGRTDFPRGDHATLIRSIRENLFPLGDEVTFLPGHGPTSTFGHERQTNPFVSDARYG